MIRLQTAFLFVIFLAGSLTAQVLVPPLFLDTTDDDIYAIADETNDFALGDIDGNGTLDLIVANGFSSPGYNKILINDGHAWLYDLTFNLLPHNSALSKAVVIGDLDGDNDLDLIFGNKGSQNTLYLNKGKGDFMVATANLPVFTDRTEDLLLEDVDGDKDLDLLVINDNEQNRLYLNDGKGKFTDATLGNLPIVKDAAWEAVACDVDADGDMDFVVVKWGPGSAGQNRLYLNNGKGKFTDVTLTNLPQVSNPTFTVEAGDVDGDGDLDLVMGNTGNNVMLLNDGKGKFTPAPPGNLPIDIQTPGDIVLADFDGDGDLDMVIANINTTAGVNRLLLNNGKGIFTDITISGLPLLNDGSMCLMAADLDSDGDVDLVVGNIGNKGQQNRLFRNLSRETYAPKRMRLGRLYELQVYTRPDHGNPLLIVFPLMATKEAYLPLGDFGILGLDLATMVPLSPQLSNPVNGHTSYVFGIPNYPDTLGMRIFFQSVVEYQVNSTKSLRFTNTITEVLAK